MSWQTGKRWLKRTLTWLNWTLVIPGVLLVALLFTLLYTAAGLHFNLWLAQYFVAGFSVERSEGSLLGGNSLYGLRWQNDSISFALQQSQLHINNRCFLRLTLCVEQLALQGMQLEIADTENAPPPDKQQAATGFWLPFAIDITQLQLNNAAVLIGGNRLHWRQFSTGAQLWGNKIQLNQPHWQQLTLALAETTAAPATEDAFSYQPPVLSDIKLPLSLFIDRFRLTGFTLQQQEPLVINELAFSLQLLPDQINLTQLDISHPQATLNASARLHTSGHYPLKADLRLVLQDSELSGQRLRLTLDGDLGNLQLNAYASERLNAELSLWLNLLDSSLPLRASLNAGQWQWPQAEPELQLHQLQLNATGNLEQLRFSSQLALSGKQLPPATVRLSGHSSLHGATLDSFIIDTLGGQLSAQAGLDWQKQLHLTGHMQLQQIQPGQFWPDYAGELNGKLRFNAGTTEQGGWQLALPQLQLNGKLRDYELQLNGSLTAADHTGQGDYQLHTPGLTLHHAQNQLQLTGSLDQQWQLALNITVPELAQSISGASGNIQAAFNLSGARETPRLQGKLSASALQWQDATLEQLTLDSDIGLTAEHHLSTALSLQAQNGLYRQPGSEVLSIERFSLTLNGSELQHQLVLVLNSAEHNADIELNGSFKRDEYWQADLVSARLDSLLGAWHLTDSTALDYQFASGRFTVQPHCWQQAPSKLCAVKPLKLSAEHIELDLALQQFALPALAMLLPEHMVLQGSIDAQLQANWQQGQQPQAELKLSGSDGHGQYKAEQPLTLAWQGWQLNANLAQDTLSTALQWHFSDSARVHSEASITALLSDARHVQGTLLLQQFSLAFLQPLLEEHSELAGLLNSDLSFSGDLANPAINGNLALTQFRLAGKQTPLDVTAASIGLNFSGRQATLDGRVNTSSGQINLNGGAQWQQLADWQATLQVKGDELSLQIPQAQLQIAPDLTLSARPGLTSVSGSVHIPFARISVDSLPQSAVGLSDDLVLLDSALQPVPTAEKAAFALQTDINVILGRRVQLSAFGLQTRLSGNLRVRQQPDQQPTVNGDVSLLDGTFRAYGQDLLIRQGKMNFNGPADQPFLNVEAIRNPANMEDDVIAGIRVSGPADEPAITIFSEPAKPQANALAYLLMGRDIGSDSGSASAALTTSLIGMSISSSSALVGEIGEAFGVRDLTLDTAGAGDNSKVTVSGYLSRDLQVKYGYGIFNAIGEFTLRYRLMRNLYLEAVTSLDNAVDLLYKFEFD